MDDDTMRVWAATQAEIEALRASVARLAAERDAVLAAAVRDVLRPLPWTEDDPAPAPVWPWALGSRSGCAASEAEARAAVRRAAGLEEEPAP
jgi:hypothetical protein